MKADSNVTSSTAPVFIVGAARSGTTLLQYMLRSHPALSLPTGESHFIVPVYQGRSRFGDLKKEANVRDLLNHIYASRREFLDTDLHGLDFSIDAMVEKMLDEDRDSIPAIIRGMFEANAQGEGKRRWGDKTPYYSLHLPLLLEMFPDMQVVHLVRDGRDCCISMLQRKKDLHIYNTYHAAYLWCRYVEHARAFGRMHPERYFELRYEDLTSNPEPRLRQLCDFLGERYDSSLINFGRAKEAGATPLVGQPLQSGNTEKWRSRMTRHQLRIFEAKARDVLRSCGYEPATPDSRFGKIERQVHEMILSARFRLDGFLPDAKK